MNCRSCENDNVVSIFSLGNMPLANRLLKHEQLKEIEPKYNLEIALCQSCGLVQLTDIVSPEVLFNEYLYFSSNSETMIQSAKKLVESLIPTLSNNSLAIEIASNDGYLLQHYMKKNIQVLGIEPAKNIADCALIKGIPTRCEYFSKNFAHSLTQEGIQADIIHANNVMAHVPNINDFVAGIKILLKTTGQAIIEVPYLLNLIKHSEFDTIYHEHVFYFSLLPLQALFKRHQLNIQHVEEIAIHGGSLRLFIRHENGNVSSEAVQKLISNEINLGITNVKYYHHFSHQISILKEKLLILLQNLKNQGHKIAAYGASAKGSTLLNFFGIGKNYLDFIVDRSPAKQNYYMSGTHIPIFHPDFLLSKKIPYTLLLTWNFSQEILMQQQNYRNQGGQFIIPIPKLEIV
jgi:SAM-dependent methyltransferase